MAESKLFDRVEFDGSLPLMQVDEACNIPWTLHQMPEEDAALPGLQVYAFTRGTDATVMCFAQTDLDALYSRYPGLKKAIIKEMRNYTNDNRLYFKTKPSENRQHFAACFSNNATNGKCLVPVEVVHAAMAELDVEREMRRDSIAAFVSRMSRHEKEWVLQELVQSIGVVAAPAPSASTTTISVFPPASLAGDVASVPTPPLAATSLHSPSSPSSASLPSSTTPTQPSFFDMFVRSRNLASAATVAPASNAADVDAPAAGATAPGASVPRSNSGNGSFSLVLDEAETNPLFGSLSLFGGELETEQREHKRKRMNSIDADDLPTLALPVAALVAAPQLAAAVRAPFVPMARDREWTQPAPQPAAVSNGEFALDDGAGEFLQRDGSLLFGLRAGRTSPGAESSAAHLLQSASDMFMEATTVGVASTTTVVIPPQRDRMILRTLKATGRAAFR